MRMEKKYNLLDMILQKHEEHSSDWEKMPQRQKVPG